MTSLLPVYPFDNQRCIGTITEVGPALARANLPNAAIAEGQWLHGHRLGAGEVGEFVLVECGEFAIFGRLVNVKLPERDRLTVEPQFGATREAHPVGTVQLLTSVAVKDGRITGGLSMYPRLGAKVYSAHPSLVKWIAESAQSTAEHPDPLVLKLAFLPSAKETAVNFTPERLFGRHCAVLGATGGGKSWSIARLIEQVLPCKAKVVLFDATGEFYTLPAPVSHVHIGAGKPFPNSSKELVLPYNELMEGDLLALFKPSGLAQGPKLRLAMKSLKLAKLVPALAPKGFYEKVQKSKADYEKHYAQEAEKVEGPRADFEIKHLVRQINEECVYPSAGYAQNPDFSKWGNANDQERGYCVTLLARIEEMLSSKDLACIFQSSGKTSVIEELESFFKSSDQQVFRVSLKYVPFGHNTREIVANALGRYLLAVAREGRFREQPLVIFLDEAHQFLNKQLGDENTRYPLDSFELIAKEGRKFSLNICIATQRPRDIPEGVLSQIGTLIVHRLTNDRDREVVERASGEIDRSAAAFLPTLAPGQAIIIGVDFPMPLTIQVAEPTQKPDSKGPNYQVHWRHKKAVSDTQHQETKKTTKK